MFHKTGVKLIGEFGSKFDSTAIQKLLESFQTALIEGGFFNYDNTLKTSLITALTEAQQNAENFPFSFLGHANLILDEFISGKASLNNFGITIIDPNVTFEVGLPKAVFKPKSRSKNNSPAFSFALEEKKEQGEEPVVNMDIESQSEPFEFGK